MNLCLLVEGRHTERRVYESWIGHTFPGLHLVRRLSELTQDSYLILSGYGNPAYLVRIPALLAEIANYPVDHFFVCVDAEEEPYTAVFAPVRQAVDEAERASGIHQRRPRFRSHVIIQNCCIETWFLGHDRMLRRNPTSPKLAELKRFYDVSSDDPEDMGKPSGYTTRAQFHLEYLREMLHEQGKVYSKLNPGVVLEANYLDALRRRCASTGHLPSLQVLLSTWSSLG
jgi:hypothetical protein